MEISPQIVLQTTENEVVPGETARYPFVLRTGARLPEAAEFGVTPDNASFDPRWARVVRTTDEWQVTRYQLEVTPVHVARDQYGQHSLAVYWRAAGYAQAQCVLVIKPGVRLTGKPVLQTWPAGKLTLSIENFSQSGVDVEISVKHHGSSWSQGWDYGLEAGSGPVKFSEEFEPPEEGRHGTFTLTVSAAGIPLAEADLAGRRLTFPRKAAVTAAVAAVGAGLGIALATVGPGGHSDVKQVVATSPATPSGTLGPSGIATSPGGSLATASSPAAGPSGTTGTPTASATGTVRPVLLGQAIMFSSTPPASAAPGDIYLVTATGGPSGEPVKFTIDDSATSVCSIDDRTATVTFQQEGHCLIDANQAGNDQYSAAAQAQQAVVVAKLPQTIGFTLPATVLEKTSSQLTAQGGLSGDAVTFTVDPASTDNPDKTAKVCTIDDSPVPNTVHYNSVGTCVIDAIQPGNSRYEAAQVRQQAMVQLSSPG